MRFNKIRFTNKFKEIAINIHPGDTIHHPLHGIGRVESIRERSFSREKNDTFAKLYFGRDGLTLMLREQDLEQTVRTPISKKEAGKLLEHLYNWNGKVGNSWKVRASANQSVLESGDPFGYVDVYKGLSKLELEGTLRASDRQHLNQSLELLVEELAYATGGTPEQARKQITS